MDRIFQRIVDNRFSEFEGLTADASIPVPQRIINESIQAALQGNQNIEYCVLTILGENQISVSLKSTLWPWPVDLKLRLERSVDFTDSPKVRARLENNLLLGKLGSFFKALPEWVTLDGAQVVIDIETLLTPEQLRFVDLIKAVEIDTEPGKAIFHVHIRID
jgi:hypothetical protein